jgi:hypothetical protein
MNKWLLLLIIPSFLACRKSKVSEPSKKSYFDLKTYFEKEAVRLSKLNPSLKKRVSINEDEQSQTLKITNWPTELEIFKEADINKSSWKGEFTISKQNNQWQYQTKNPKIPVKLIEIIETEGQVKSIKIIKSTHNIFYQTTDSLLYYPDSLYQIVKHQDIRLLKPKRYEVIAKF